MTQLTEGQQKFQDNRIAPMHTTEHILNQTMVRLMGSDRSFSAHIERRKSKCDYYLDQAPTDEQVQAIEDQVNQVIMSNLPVTEHFMPIEAAGKIADLSKLPEGISGDIRIIKVGDYDAIPCVGTHVSNTSVIGRFDITTHTYTDGVWRVRFRLRPRD